MLRRSSSSLESFTSRLVRTNVARVSWPECPESTLLFSIENVLFIIKVYTKANIQEPNRIVKIFKKDGVYRRPC